MEQDLIKGERLTTWTVTPDGERAQLSFEDDAGQRRAVSLPISLLSALMMTIPRMLRQALQARFGDGSMRMVQELGDWRVERAVGADAFVLSLTTTDGFEVMFAVATRQASQLGETLRHLANPTAAAACVVN